MRDAREPGSARRLRSFLVNGIEKQATFYRGYLPDDHSLVPLTIALATSVALWFIVYLVGAVGGVPQNQGAAVAGFACHVRDPRAADPRAALSALPREGGKPRMNRVALGPQSGKQTPAWVRLSTCSARAFLGDQDGARHNG
jgi:hypothetical protein